MRRTAFALLPLSLVAGVLAVFSIAARSPAPARPAPWATLASARSYLVGGGILLLGRGRATSILPGAIEPSWSPDGRRLAYVALDPDETGDVFVADADGRRVGRITQTPGVDEASPSWSPDGRRIVFEREGRITVARADGSHERVLAAGLDPAWSPGGKRIAFERGGDLFVASVSGGQARKLTSTPTPETSPSWSPEGHRLAYVSEETGAPDIRIIDLRTLQAAAVTADDATDSGPAFSADGRRLVFVSDRAGADALWRVPAAGGVPEPVGGPTSAATPQPRPDPEVTELLPDLDQQPPSELDVRTSGGRHRLWFTSAADNVGLGPFIVNGRRVAGGAMRANQRVRLGTGALRTYPEVGTWRYNASPDHSHWHLLYFQRYELRRADGAVVVRDRKSGFCIGDRYGVAPGQVDRRIPRPVYTGFCNLYQPSAREVDGGTSVGYSDRYHSRLDGQNVDITRVPAGEYVLVNRANPQLLIRELRYENDAGSVRIRIARTKGGPPRVRVLKTCPDSDRCQ